MKRNSLLLVILAIAASLNPSLCNKHADYVLSEVLTSNKNNIQVINSVNGYEKLVKYKQYIAKLPVDNPNSVINAKDKYLKFFSNTQEQKYKDMAFKCYRDFYFKTCRILDGENTLDIYFKYSNKYKPKDYDTDKQQDIDSDVYKFYKAKGYNVWLYEASFSLYDDADFLKKNFSSYLSPMWQEFLKLRLIEQNQLGYGYSEDEPGADDKLRKQIILWENFINKYPSFPEINELKAKISDYFNSYIFPKYSYSEKGEIVPELKKSYETFLVKNKNSKYYPTVKKWYSLLKKNNFIYLWCFDGEKEIINDKAYKQFKINQPYKPSKYNGNIYPAFNT
ncbi:MAG: hypothetical protein WCK67_00700 [bacterium]